MSVARPVSQYGGPPPQHLSAPPQPPVPSYAQQPQQSNPLAEMLAALGLLFFLRRYRPGYVARRQSSGCCGCLVLLVILLIFVGIPGYIAYKNAAPQIQRQLQTSNETTPTSQPAITTVNINQTVTYASVDLTLVTAQQSSAFLDDPSTVTNGMIRVNIKESNNSKGNPNYLYSDIAKILLPNQNSVALTNAQQAISPTNGVTRTNWLDFAVPSGTHLDQLTLLLGTSQTVQMRVPLTGKANLSAFQAKTINPNKPISYAGLNWTLKSATLTMSADDKQADTGMRYVVLSFTADNPTSASVVIGFANEYMRMKAGSTVSPALSTTLPLSIDAQTNGVSGTATFLVPENTTSFTLVLLGGLVGSDPHSNVPVNTDFAFR